MSISKRMVGAEGGRASDSKTRWVLVGEGEQKGGCMRADEGKWVGVSKSRVG